MKGTITLYHGGKPYITDSNFNFDICCICHGVLRIDWKKPLDEDGVKQLQRIRNTFPMCPGHPDSVAGLEARYADGDAFLATMGEIILRVLTENPDEVYRQYQHFEALYRDMQRVIRENVKDEVRA